MATNDTLTSPTPGQIKYRNRLWAQALMENERKATGQMREKGGRCCLQVAEDVAIANGLAIKRSGANDGTPNEAVGDFFGWNGNNPYLSLPNGSILIASRLNDGDKSLGGKGLSHKKIAECVLNTFVRPQKQKWSFGIKNGKVKKKFAPGNTKQKSGAV